MEVIKNFFNDYGYSFLMMVIIGAVVALILELTVKKAIVWLEEKLAGNAKALALVAALKTVAIQVVTWTLVVSFLNGLIECMDLPGTKVLYPVWLCLEYVIQYLFSCWGIKGLQEFAAKRIERAEARADAKAEAEAHKPTLVQVPGKGYYNMIDSNGNLVKDQYGREVIVDAKGRKL